jgi:TRAP-type C4-dicarboxylate transport system substrate-binding protein
MKNRTIASLRTFVFALAIATFGFLPAAMSPASAADAYVMKIGDASINDQNYEWLKRYKAAVEKDSGNRIRVDIYPLSQLGSIPRMIEGTQFGSIQGWVGPPAFLSGIDARYEILETPGVCATPEQFIRTIEDPQFSKAFLGLGGDKGLVGISLFYNDQVSLFFRKPVHTLADASGLKIRSTAGPVTDRMIRAFDATPVPMPLDQVLTALQQGALDGALATIAVVTPQKYYTVTPYVVPVDRAFSASITVIGKAWFDALPVDLQRIVTSDGLHVGRDTESFTHKYLIDQKAVWTAEGGSYITLPAADRKTLDARIQSIGTDLFATSPTVGAIYKTFVDAAARSR